MLNSKDSNIFFCSKMQKADKVFFIVIIVISEYVYMNQELLYKNTYLKNTF